MIDHDATAQLSADLEGAVLRALLSEWHGINQNHFRRVLVAPGFLLSFGEGRLGLWSPRDRTIAIARSLVLTQPWGVVVEVLKHEVAHQYAHEVMRATDETAHGQAFQKACAHLGIDPAASGMPGASEHAGEEGRILSRIAKLLALAGSSNQHEAELAMREAQRLMLKHNLAEAAIGAQRGYGYRHLGEPTGRLQGHQRILGALLGSHFFVEVIWVTVHRPRDGIAGTVLEVCGTEANLEIASYAHDFLLRTGERLWWEHKRAHGLQSDADRRSFLAGVMRGFHEKLDEQARVNLREGLVWIKDAALQHFYRRRHPRTSTLRTQARARPEAYAHGKAAGRAITLHRPVSGHSTTAPKLLGPK